MNRKLYDMEIIDDELVDGIVDEILDSMKKEKIPVKADAFQRRNLSEIVRLQARIANLENRVEKFVRNFKISATESVRQISETERGLEEENEQQIMQLQGQIENLRTAMIRLGSEVKRLKDALYPSK